MCVGLQGGLRKLVKGTGLMEALQPMPFVVLEGINGVGKTAVSRKLARLMGAVRLQTPPKRFGTTAEYVDRDPKSVAHLLFYLAAAHYVSECVSVHLPLRPVVCDRYVLCTFAYHAACNQALPFGPADFGLTLPTATFLLTAKESKRKRRMCRRRNRSKAETDLDDPVMVLRVLQAYRRYELIEVDTTDVSVAQVAEEIVTLLHEKPCQRLDRTSHVNKAVPDCQSLDSIAEFYLGLGFRGCQLRKVLEQDHEYQQLLQARRLQLDTRYINTVSEAERDMYLLSVQEDFEILEKCKRIERARISAEDRLLTRLIKTQLKDDWRTDILETLNGLLNKYEV